MKRILSVLLLLTLALAPCASAETVPEMISVPEQTAAAEPAEMSAPEQTPSAVPTVAPTAAPTPEPLPLEGVIIGIDPGHQAHANSEKEPVAPGSSEKKKKVSSGTSGVATGVAEYIVNLDVAMKLRDALQALGCTAVMTREVHDINISNVERAKMMNEANVDLWLRIHCNGSTNRKKTGMGMYVVKSGATAEESRRAGECLLEAMFESTGRTEGKVVRSNDYSGNNWSEKPCVLVEMGYMSNAEEDALLNTPDYQDKLVAGMVAGIRAFVGK